MAEFVGIVLGALFTAGVTVGGLRWAIKGLSAGQKDMAVKVGTIADTVTSLDKTMAVHIQASDDAMRRLGEAESDIKEHDRRIVALERSKPNGHAIN